MTEKKERKKSFFKRLLHRQPPPDKTEDKTESNIPKSWRKTNPTSAPTPTSTITKPRLFKEKIRIPFLKTAKRYVAALLLLVNGFLFLMLLGYTPSTLTQGMSLLFLGNSFILLDYLWKSSSWRVTKKNE